MADYIKITGYPDNEPPVIRISTNMFIADEADIKDGNIYLTIPQSGKFLGEFAQAFQDITDYLRKKGAH